MAVLCRDYRHLNLRPSQAQFDPGDADYQQHVNRAAGWATNRGEYRIGVEASALRRWTARTSTPQVLSIFDLGSYKIAKPRIENTFAGHSGRLRELRADHRQSEVTDLTFRIGDQPPGTRTATSNAPQ
jgi:hypothetical protein